MGKMLLHYDKARKISADMSARFVQFREVLLAMEGKTDANGWAAEFCFTHDSRQGLADVAECRTQPHSHKGCAP